MERNDFDEYVNGEWRKTAVIRNDRVKCGSFMDAIDDNQLKLKTICESDTGLVGQLYSKANTVPAEISLTVSRLTNINITTVEDYFSTAAKFFTYGISSLFHICKGPDDKNPLLQVPHIRQAGLGLPDMSFYTDKPELHDPYRKFIVNICSLHNISVDADALFDYERQLAALHLTQVQRRDSVTVYNKMEWSEIRALLPAYFDVLTLDLPVMTYAIVQNPKLLASLEQLARSVPTKTLRDHLVFRAITTFASYQTAEIVECAFNFYGKLLSGQQKIRDQWERALGVVSTHIGEELGKLYVSAHFSQDRKTECEIMVDQLREALRATLTESEWMTPETKSAALEKLTKLRVKIGYPDKYHEIDGLWQDGELHGLDLTQALVDWAVWDWKTQECNKFYTPVDQELWHMPPQMVNAYYDQNANEIVFPAGILQPPFYGFDTFEQNLGAIGVVIGHEMTHGYDDEGRKYDQNGKLQEWWSAEDSTQFNLRAKKVEDHYSGLTFMDLPINGKLTLGENIADIGGMKLALRVLKTYNPSREVYDRFFRAYANVWKMTIRKEYAKSMVVTDPHAPAKLRINAVLSHIPEFYETYGVNERDGMYLPIESRMSIW